MSIEELIDELENGVEVDCEDCFFFQRLKVNEKTNYLNCLARAELSKYIWNYDEKCPEFKEKNN